MVLMMLFTTSSRGSKSWWRDESFIQPWWLTRVESTSWWRTGFRQWRGESEREIEGQPKDQPPFVSQHLRGETVMSSLCNNEMSRACVHERSCPKNERTSKMKTCAVYFSVAGFLCSVCWSHSCFLFVLKSTWTQHEMKDEIPVTLTGWSSLKVLLFILLMRLIFIFTDRCSIGGNCHLLILLCDFYTTLTWREMIWKLFLTRM